MHMLRYKILWNIFVKFSDSLLWRFIHKVNVEVLSLIFYLLKFFLVSLIYKKKTAKL